MKKLRNTNQYVLEYNLKFTNLLINTIILYK